MNFVARERGLSSQSDQRMAHDARPLKRARTSNASSSLYAPFRALGSFTTSTPFAFSLRTARGAGPSLALVTATTPTAWALWTEEAMRLKMVSEPFTALPIEFLELDRDRVYAAAGPAIFVFERGRVVAQMRTDEEAYVGRFLVLGQQIVALSVDGTTLFVWSLDTFGEPLP